jgi:twitching motility protein PilU
MENKFNITPYLKLMVDKEASDLFFSPGSVVKMKIEGKFVSVGNTVLTTEMVTQLVYSIMEDRQLQAFKSDLEVDFAIILEHARFRVTAFHDRGQPAMVLRYINKHIPSIEDLGLPKALKELMMTKRGLILMVGATGSGKSTTLASMIEYRNHNVAGHILTVEEPIEFMYAPKKCVITQREIGRDTHSYINALKSSLRAAPDVILIGEIRNRETMGTAIELAGSGHLVITTLHAHSATQAIERIVNMFRPDLRQQLFMNLSFNLRAVISQRLVNGIDGKRKAAVEVMINTPYIAELLLNGKVGEIKEAMENTRESGMQSFDTALSNLYRQGVIALEEALSNADSRTNLEARINFG